MQDTAYQSILDDRVDLSLYDPPQSMIPDGFAANNCTVYLPRYYYDQTVKQIEWLREATGAMWPRTYAIPLDRSYVIEAYDTYSTQYRIVPGSYIWGWDISVASGTLTNVYINITDPCSQRSIFSSYVNASMLTSTRTWKRPRVLSRPYRVDSQGLIDIQIRNNSASDLILCYVLHVSEPSESLSGTVVPPQDLETL